MMSELNMSRIIVSGYQGNASKAGVEMKARNPVEHMASVRHEFGEHGGVEMASVQITATTAWSFLPLKDFRHRT